MLYAFANHSCSNRENDVGDKIKKLFQEESKDTNVIVLTAMGEESAMDAKEAPK